MSLQLVLHHTRAAYSVSHIWKMCVHQLRYSSTHSKHTHARPDWNKAVSDAEKIVGYPTSFLSLRWLLSDEIANVALHLRKLVGSSHPLLKTAKNLLYTGSNNMQAWGLIVLLISKTVGYSPNIKEIEQDKSAGVLHSQRALAEVTEMIRTSNLIHKGLINIYPGLYSDENVLNDMEFGNKIALLSGDYLLSNSCAELAALKNQYLVELMSSAVRDLAEGEFVGRQDKQNNPLPPKHLCSTSESLTLENIASQQENHDQSQSSESTPIEEMSWQGVTSQKQSSFSSHKSVSDLVASLPLLQNNPQDIALLFETHSRAAEDWTSRNLLLGASLLGKSCKGALLLAGHNESIQQLGYDFGKHLALSWQAFIELESFAQQNQQYCDGNSSATSSTLEPLSLVSAPVLFHLEYATHKSRNIVAKQIEKGEDSVLHINLNIVHKEVSQGPGIQMTKLLQHYHSTKALNVLLQFEPSDAKNALIKIIQVMGSI